MKKMKKILIVLAHLDDLEFGAIYLSSKLNKPNNIIHLIICSSGLSSKSENFNKERRIVQMVNASKIFNKVSNLKIIINHEYIDTTFPENRVQVRKFIEDNSKENYCTLISHVPDIHCDHTIVSELVDIIARPNIFNLRKSKFKKYIKIVIPSNEYLKNYGIGKNINISNHKIIKLTKDYKKYKLNLLKRYSFMFKNSFSSLKIIDIPEEYYTVYNLKGIR